jgi:hypothetical protein
MTGVEDLYDKILTSLCIIANQYVGSFTLGTFNETFASLVKKKMFHPSI